MRLVGFAVLLLVAGCREAPRGITAADLQGVWIKAEESGLRDISPGNDDAFAVQGDSIFEPFEAIYRRTEPDSSAWRPSKPVDWAAWELTGDTLLHSLESEGAYDQYVRLGADPRAPRPGRLAIRFGGCFGGCPVMDAEIDSTGAFWVLEGGEVEAAGRYVARGQRALYNRLSRRAAELRLDRPHPEVGITVDALSTLLVAWYDGKPRVFDGSADEFGPLLLVVAEMATAARTLPMETTAARHHFASRDALGYRFLSHPEVVREVFGETPR